MAAAENQRTKPAAKLVFKRYFLPALLLCTWLPIVFFILLAPPEGAPGGLAHIKTLFLFLGTAHVPATLFFYTDKDFSGIINNHRLRYVVVPIFLIIVTGLLFSLLNPAGQAFLLLAYWAWQAFHYGRQNIGVYSFASIAETATSPHRAEKLAIDFGTVLGILGTFKILGMAVAPAYLYVSFDFLYKIGSLAFAAVLIFSLVVYVKYFRHTTTLKTVFFFTSVFFFYPVFISTNMNVAFLSYAIAHGLQYLVFMTVVSANSAAEDRPRRPPYGNILKLVIFSAVLGFLFWRVGDLRQIDIVKSNRFYAATADFLFGAVLGATMSHFVVDASAWKLSLAQQRAYISRRFDFLFGKKSEPEVKPAVG